MVWNMPHHVSGFNDAFISVVSNLHTKHYLSVNRKRNSLVEDVYQGLR